MVLSLLSEDGRPLHRLTADDQERIAAYFRRYKEHEPAAFSKVPGWGTIAEGEALVARSHAFFGR